VRRRTRFSGQCASHHLSDLPEIRPVVPNDVLATDTRVVPLRGHEPPRSVRQPLQSVSQAFVYEHACVREALRDSDNVDATSPIGSAAVLDVRSVAADPRTVFKTVSDRLGQLSTRGRRRLKPDSSPHEAWEESINSDLHSHCR
jgi:hypothetical protein